MSELRMGVYRHYKGQLYQVIGLAHDANAGTLHSRPAGGQIPEEWHLGERTVVVYMPLQLDGAHLGPRMAVRTLEDFTATVCVDQYGTVYEGDPASTHAVQRFEYLGPYLTAGMLT